MAKKQDRALPFAIMFAAVVVSASIIFFGLQMQDKGSASDLQAQIAQGIEDYVEEATGQRQADSHNHGGEQATGQAEDLLDDNDPFIGSPDAPVTIVEFSDFQCPFCRVFYEDTYQKLKTAYVDTGKVKLVYKHLPLSIHADAMEASIASMCALEQGDDETFFAYHDLVFEGQGPAANGTVAITTEQLEGYAAELGLDGAEFSECLSSEKYLGAVQEDMAIARSVGIGGTPNFVVGNTLLEGAQKFETFARTIDAQLQ